MNALENQLSQRLWESIECEEAKLKARRTNPLFPTNNEKLKCRVWPWKLNEAAVAEILTELNPKVAIIDANSRLDAGDRIVGKIIEGFSTRPIPPPAVRPDSGRHRGQFSIASGFVYCKVLARYYDIQP